MAGVDGVAAAGDEDCSRPVEKGRVSLNPCDLCPCVHVAAATTRRQGAAPLLTEREVTLLSRFASGVGPYMREGAFTSVVALAM